MGVFTLDPGEDAPTDCHFNRKVIHPYLCSTCGIRSFARGASQDGTAMVAVNVPCVDDIELATVPTVQCDGRSR